MEVGVALYCLVIGILIAAWWANDLRRGAWNRGDRTHAEMALHLTAEFVTAGFLVGSGVARLWVGEGADPFVAAALGMLLYTTIVSPGYFLARREMPVVGMFAVLAALTVLSLTIVLA